MSFKDPKDELAQFLAQLPPSAEKIFWGKGSPEELPASLLGESHKMWEDLEDRYESILRRIPDRWR